MKTHSMRHVRYIVIVFILALLATTTWGQQKHRATSKKEIDDLGYKKVTRHFLYSEGISGGGSFSKQGSYRNFVVLQFGHRWPKLPGLEATLVEGLMTGNFDSSKGIFFDNPKGIYSWFPFGIYLPLLTVDRPGFWQGSILNLSARAHLFPQYRDYLPDEDGNYSLSDNVSFPRFFDVCLEWRGPLHTISVGYRHQTKPFEYKREGWPHGLDMSGVFASVRVGLSNARPDTIKKRLPNAEKIEALYYEGEKSYSQDNFHQAAQKWEQALEIAKNSEAKKWSCFLLAELGDAYHNHGKYQEALSYYEQAVEIYGELEDKAEIARTSKNIADAYRVLGSFYYRHADYQKSIFYYTEALEIDKKLGDKEKIGDTFAGLGLAYQHLGNLGKKSTYYLNAISYYKQARVALLDEGSQFCDQQDYHQGAQKWEEALKITKKLSKMVRNKEAEKALSLPIKEAEGTLLTDLGYIYMQFLSRYPKAASYFEQALEIYRVIGDKEGVGYALSALGVVYIHLGDYPKAISYYEQALKIHRELGNKKGIGDGFTGIGNAYFSLHDFPKAISYYEQALKIHRELGDKEGIGADFSNFGNVYHTLGDYPKAIFYYEQALKIHRELGNKKGIGDGFRRIGNAYFSLYDFPKAISYYEQALKIHRELGDKEGIGADFSNLGNIYCILDNHPKGISYYEQALKIHREIGVPTEVLEKNMAHAWLEIGEVQKAEKIYLRLKEPIGLGILNLAKKNYRKAIEFFEKSLKQVLDSRIAIYLFADYFGLGQAYEGLKEYDKAREYYDKAIDIAEEQRGALAEAERDLSRSLGELTLKFLQGRFRPYEGMVRVGIAMETPKDAFFYSENLKSRVLAESIASGQSALEQSLPSDLRREENSYITRLMGLRKQMEALYRKRAMDIYYEREKELKEVKAKQQEFIRRLRASYPEYASIRYLQPIRPSEVELTPNEVMVEFEVTHNATYVFMLKEGKLKTRRVSISREELQELVLQYRGFFEGITKTSQLLEYEPEVGKKLYELLFGDLLQYVAEGGTLIIVPDEFLGILPFEALVVDLPAVEKMGDGEYGPFPLGVKYLGDKYLISYAQSATALNMLRTLKKGEASGESVLIVADPIFSANDPRLGRVTQGEASGEKLNLMSAIASWKGMGVAGVRARGKGQETLSVADEIFPRLEKTGEIARGMESLFGHEAKVLLGMDSREDKVLGLPLPEYRYLIFATHGILDNTVPWIREPALVLTQVGNPKDCDGFLTMSEVMSLKLGADVVALTACGTGVGENVTGEGVMGMGRAFQYAGASDVLISLWPVAEISATQLTIAFFKHLKEGKEPRQAIKLARNDVRRKGFEHPFYWAAFILVGR